MEESGFVNCIIRVYVLNAVAFRNVFLKDYFVTSQHAKGFVQVRDRFLTFPSLTIVKLSPGMFAHCITSATNASTSASMSCASPRDVITAKKTTQTEKCHIVLVAFVANCKC